MNYGTKTKTDKCKMIKYRENKVHGRRSNCKNCLNFVIYAKMLKIQNKFFNAQLPQLSLFFNLFVKNSSEISENLVHFLYKSHNFRSILWEIEVQKLQKYSKS